MVNSKGVVVHSELKGALQMKAYLSGMPECKLGLNDKTMFARQVRCGRVADYAQRGHELCSCGRAAAAMYVARESAKRSAPLAH